MSFLYDTSWSDKAGPRSLQLGLATFGILALELALIRWTSGQVRVFAYFNNLVLIGAFMGMGLGIALGRRLPGLVHLTLPVLLLISLPLAFSMELDIVHLSFPDETVFLWGADQVKGGTWDHIRNALVFLLVFCGQAAVFVLAGTAVGALFHRMPPLRAYAFDLLGSLLGVCAFTGLTIFHASPPFWLALGCLPFAWLSRRVTSLVALAGIVFLGWYSIQGAVYSPYNRIDVHAKRGEYKLDVNRDFHQFMHNLSDEKASAPGLDEKSRLVLFGLRRVYDVPFRVNPHRGRAVVVGAGTGNDVQAALRNGYREVYSVDIDGRIIDLGKRLHPEKPYDDPRARPVVNDARAFFEQYQGPRFDVICYGLLDSHAMFSSMSSLRLDNYVYTEEGIRSAWNHVSDRGHLSIRFGLWAGPWIGDRLYWTIARATGQEPLYYFHGRSLGATFLVAKVPGTLDLEPLAGFPRLRPKKPEAAVTTTNDDWPFLYIRPGHFPWVYLVVLMAVLLIAAVATPLAFGRRNMTRDFDPILFFMGAAFLLIETRGVTSLSLLFGSTWAVNSAVFAGILIMVLLANLAVLRLGLRRPLPWFIGLLLAVILLWAFPVSILNQLPLLPRGLLGGLINGLPIGFAGVIVSIILSRSRNPTASLGSNLLGSVLGGCIEYASMFTGLSSMVLLALAFYLAALFVILRRG